jgi:methyl-accepting chemotaxis protein
LSKVSSDLILAKYIFNSDGSPLINSEKIISLNVIDQISKLVKKINLPVLEINDKQILYNYETVDEIKKYAGGTATVFQVIPGGLLRISTNVMKTDGQRAVGTYIPESSPVYKTVMSGKTYYGRAYVVNTWYMTAYEPFSDRDGKIIGVLYVGVREDQFKNRIIEELNKTNIGKSGRYFIIDEDENILISKSEKLKELTMKQTLDNSGDNFIFTYDEENQESSQKGKIVSVGILLLILTSNVLYPK